MKGDRITVTDATGHTWQTSDIYQTSIRLAVYGMLFLALLALLRIASGTPKDQKHPKVVAAS